MNLYPYLCKAVAEEFRHDPRSLSRAATLLAAAQLFHEFHEGRDAPFAKGEDYSGEVVRLCNALGLDTAELAMKVQCLDDMESKLRFQSRFNR